MIGIHLAFCINDRSPLKQVDAVANLMIENKLTAKVACSFYDTDGECTFYVISDKPMSTRRVHDEVNALIENNDERWIGHL